MPPKSSGRPPTMPNRLARAIHVVVVSVSAVAVTAPVLHAQGVPPTTVSDSTQTAVVKHTVKRGDTLWDIARYYLKDPFKWPQVFHANTDIVKNPHWIYPGQVLTIEASAVKPEIAARADSSGIVVAQIQTRSQQPTVFAESRVTQVAEQVGATSVPPALTVRPGEYEAAPYVVDGRSPLVAGKVLGAVDAPALGLSSDAGFKLFDRIYLTVPVDLPMAVGDHMIVARTDESITDVGRVVEPTGVLRIDSLASGRHAIATIVRQFAAITPGQSIVAPGRSFEQTSVRPVVGSYPLTAKLLWIQGSPKLPSVQTYVVLGAGEGAGVRAGDRFTVLADSRFSDGTRAPSVATATVTVVRVTPLAATAIVVHQTQPEIREGMPTRLTARMP